MIMTGVTVICAGVTVTDGHGRVTIMMTLSNIRLSLQPLS
jgi:hypothetical protein